MLPRVRPWAIWLAGTTLVAACALSGAVLRNARDPAPALAGDTAGSDEAPDDAWAVDPANPANGPFPGPGDELSPEQQRAVGSVVELARAGALTRVVSVEKSTYAKAMCGFFRQPSIGDVWVVWFEGPFRGSVPSIPSGAVMPDRWLPHHFDQQVFIVDATNYVSLQRVVEWPIPGCQGR